MSFSLKTLIKITGVLLLVTGIAMLVPLAMSVHYGERECTLGFLISGAASIVFGFITYKFIKPSKSSPKARDGYLIVVIAWLICSAFAALPYVLSGHVTSYIDALFEAIAGYTTTGATVIGETGMNNSMIMWKAITHWLGGMGILVFIISILPSLGVSGQKIAIAEAPGPSLVKVAPRIQDLAKLLYMIYLTLTAAEFVLLLFSDMGAFEALVNTMGSVSTAGLLLYSDGIAHYNSLYVEMVISLFTVLSSVNYIVYIYILKRNFRDVKNYYEFRVFITIIASATLLVAVVLSFSNYYTSFWETLRYAFFQVTAFITTSGYTIGGYAAWPEFCKAILLCVLFVGGCACSTCGSIKVIRIMIAFKLIVRGFYLRLHPRAVKAVKIGNESVSAPMAASIAAFIMLYFAIFLFASLVFSLQGLDLETTFGTTAALLSNTGVGLCQELSSGYFGMYGDGLKVFCMFLMITGRLELYTVLVLFFPSFWNPNRFGKN